MIKLATTTVLVTLCLLGFSASVPVTWAETSAQGTPAAPTPTLTDEPVKPPYVFPTPIFIPTYPGETQAQPTAAPGTSSQNTPSTYTVQSGDSPWTISKKVYGDGTKYRQIMSANGLTDSTRLRVGAVLTIPPLAGSSAPSTAASVTPAAAPATKAAPAPTGVPAATAAPRVEPTATPAVSRSGFDETTVVGLATTAVNVGSAILVLASLLSATLAVFAYIRARRMQMLNMRKIRLMIRQ